MHCHKVTVKLKRLELFCTEKAEHINKTMASPLQLYDMKIASKSVQKKLQFSQFVSLVLWSRLGGAGGGPRRSVA